MPRVDYDRIAPGYDRRFADGQRSDTAFALRELARQVSGGRTLEVGCGTGRWLAEFQESAQCPCGVDLSTGMLSQARRRCASLALVRGEAAQLPFPDATFDLVYCVNAIHHFGHPRTFVSEGRRLLRPGGALAVIGMDPHDQRECWYVYDYFDGVYETDLRRFPSWGMVLDWMVDEGLGRAECRQVEHIQQRMVGREVLRDPFLAKDSCSQLTLLTDEAYAAGIARIEDALREAEAAAKQRVFTTDLSLAMLVGWARRSKED